MRERLAAAVFLASGLFGVLSVHPSAAMRPLYLSAPGDPAFGVDLGPSWSDGPWPGPTGPYTELRPEPLPWLARMFRQARASGAAWVRFEVPWSLVEADRRGVQDWTRADLLVDLARQHDLEPFMVIGRSPHWAAGAPEGLPAAATEVRDFFRSLAARYRGRVSCYEVWDSPDDPMRFAGSAEEYVRRILAPAAHAVASSSPGTRLYLGAASDPAWIATVWAQAGALHLPVAGVARRIAPEVGGEIPGPWVVSGGDPVAAVRAGLASGMAQPAVFVPLLGRTPDAPASGTACPPLLLNGLEPGPAHGALAVLMGARAPAASGPVAAGDVVLASRRTTPPWAGGTVVLEPGPVEITVDSGSAGRSVEARLEGAPPGWSVQVQAGGRVRVRGQALGPRRLHLRAWCGLEDEGCADAMDLAVLDPEVWQVALETRGRARAVNQAVFDADPGTGLSSPFKTELGWDRAVLVQELRCTVSEGYGKLTFQWMRAGAEVARSSAWVVARGEAHRVIHLGPERSAALPVACDGVRIVADGSARVLDLQFLGRVP